MLPAIFELRGSHPWPPRPEVAAMDGRHPWEKGFVVKPSRTLGIPFAGVWETVSPPTPPAAAVTPYHYSAPS